MTVRTDRGSISVWMAIVVIVVVGFVGLTTDGSGQLRALSRAEHVAAEAARAGGQGIDLNKAIIGGPIVLDPQLARADAVAYLRAAGAAPSSTVTVSADLRHVTVVAVITYQPQFLGAFGIGVRPVTATITADVIAQ